MSTTETIFQSFGNETEVIDEDGEKVIVTITPSLFNFHQFVRSFKNKIFRIAFNRNLKEIYEPMDQEWLEEYYFDCEHRNEVQAWYASSFALKQKISEWANVIDKQWRDARRMEYLAEELRRLNQEIEDLQLLKNNPVFFVLVNDLQKAEKLYRRYYLEYGYLKANVPREKMEVDLDRLRAIPIDELFAAQWYNTGNGRKRCLCPFHNEKSGSFFVFGDNSFKCFGCGVYGSNAIDFIMAWRKCDFREAIGYLGYY